MNLAVHDVTSKQKHGKTVHHFFTKKNPCCLRYGFFGEKQLHQLFFCQKILHLKEKMVAVLVLCFCCCCCCSFSQVLFLRHLYASRLTLAENTPFAHDKPKRKGGGAQLDQQQAVATQADRQHTEPHIKLGTRARKQKKKKKKSNNNRAASTAQTT